MMMGLLMWGALLPFVTVVMTLVGGAMYHAVRKQQVKQQPALRVVDDKVD